MRFVRAILCLLGPLMLMGCMYHKITNLTPGALPRNNSGFYPVEIIWESNQRTVRYETVQPQVMIGTNSFPMKNTPKMTNRWEALVPVPTPAPELQLGCRCGHGHESFPAIGHLGGVFHGETVGANHHLWLHSLISNGALVAFPNDFHGVKTRVIAGQRARREVGNLVIHAAH